ncbi:MAG: hypothetical protein JSW61_04440 [Candidatus Thorarchaeota archaeon]|nr:MAG: hypothetical protein JSW61_04440 [Candidatus Thorarchaeota archaeon]
MTEAKAIIGDLKNAIKAYADRMADRHNLFERYSKMTGRDMLTQANSDESNRTSFTYSLFTAAELRKDALVVGVFSNLVSTLIDEILLTSDDRAQA